MMDNVTDLMAGRLLSIIPLHPLTGEELKVLEIKDAPPRIGGNNMRREIPDEVGFPYGIVEGKGPSRNELAAYRLYEGHNWRLLFDATSGIPEGRGLVVLLAYYNNVEYIYRAMIPWAGRGGPFWDIEPQYLLGVLEAGPAIFEVDKGFIIYARYKLGYRTTIDEAFYFDGSGNFIPYVYYSGLRPMGYIPIYVDFDIDGPLDDSAAAYHPEALGRWNQIVSEFESTEDRLGIPARGDLNDRLMNVLLFKQEVMWTWVEAYVNPGDHPDQYVALWQTYNTMEHPRLSIAGRDVVRKDIVYVYMIRNAHTGLYGPRFIMRQVPESSWRAAFE